MTVVTLKLDNIIKLTDDQFYQLCRQNPDVKFERNAKGELIIMPPTGGGTGKRNAKLTTRFTLWSEQTNLGEVFDSSTCFKLPNGADRSPDVAWITKERWDALTPEQQEKFPPLAPDFVLELMSPTDTLKETQSKMTEYISNGVRLGWLINRKNRTVEIYRPGQEVEVLESPTQLLGEDVLPGFVLDLQMIWD
ncbi:MAG: Uma2 family endonuclease [Scytonema sp. PMC 1069.18]|nr:Uma2 family endonuclease [Scytonema sp. PMC 1069.18]MEC4882205.1 Uma2 family endonuclease [Scytonema sp. PMC 1070.18]